MSIRFHKIYQLPPVSKIDQLSFISNVIVSQTNLLKSTRFILRSTQRYFFFPNHWIVRKTTETKRIPNSPEGAALNAIPGPAVTVWARRIYLPIQRTFENQQTGRRRPHHARARPAQHRARPAPGPRRDQGRERDAGSAAPAAEGGRPERPRVAQAALARAPPPPLDPAAARATQHPDREAWAGLTSYTTPTLAPLPFCPIAPPAPRIHPKHGALLIAPPRPLRPFISPG